MRRHATERFSWLFDRCPEKPREMGLTMVIGDGPYFVGGTSDVENLLEVAGAWVDWYKLTWASLPFQPPSVLEEKLSRLDEHDVLAFTGGNFLEAAVHDGDGTAFLEAVRETDCPGVEVSSTVVEMSVEEKAELVEAAAKMGLHVHAEIGEKASETGGRVFEPDPVIDEATACLGAGADMVILETEEIERALANGSSGNGDVSETAIEKLQRVVKAVGVENVMFEVPLAGFHDVMPASAWFIDEFGPDVNLGNINPAHVMLVEQQRRGIGPHSL